MYLKLLTIAPTALISAYAFSHSVGDGENFNPWIPDPFTSALLLLTAFLYWHGSHTSSREFPNKKKQQGYFWAGWFALVVALASPIDPMGEVLFSIHMVQHEVMMLLAAPLLVMSQPSANLLRGMPRSGARAVGGTLRGTRASGWIGWFSSPLVAWVIHAVGLWGWHVPALFSAGLNNDLVHTVQHISFLFIALVFWFALLKPKQNAPAANVIYLFTTALHASLLGALLTFSSRVWYTPYLTTAPDWGFSAIEDQQLGGLIMWMPAGIVFLAAGLVSLANAMQKSGSEERVR